METDLKPAFYALEKGGWRDYSTILHPPYTLWHLSYVVMGVALSPSLHLDRLGGTLLAFFLAVGIGAHALDELNGRPLKTHIPTWALSVAAAISIGGAVALGVVAAFTISLWLLAFVAFGGFILLAYNLELFGGRFHSNFWFALSWGAFPFLTGYWVSALDINAAAVLVAASCFGLSLAQRVLSTQVRSIRRRAVRVSGVVEFAGGKTMTLDKAVFLSSPERSLKLLSAAVVLLAIGLLAMNDALFSA